MPELLIELLVEEIPARMQTRAAADFGRLLAEGLKGAGLEHGRLETFVTPRRLGAIVEGVPAARADLREERRGPRVGAPDQAIQGFLKSVGLDSIEKCVQREVKGALYYFAAVEKKGGTAVEALPALIGAAIRGIAWPKSMRWATTTFAFVRPLHNVLALFDGKTVPGSFDCGGGVEIAFTNVTRGHRFMSPSSFPVNGVEQYRNKIKIDKVIVDPAERRATILERAEALAAQNNLVLRRDDALLDEVTGLVEWPAPVLGRIDEESMALPPEVLETSMRTHQKYFALSDRAGAMAPYFVAVSNMQTNDMGKAIVAGNERVLRARLSDARFFWNVDRKVKLESRIKALDTITWHAKLGTIGEKAARIEALAAEIAKSVPGAEAAKVRRAAALAKADLTAGMVGEFPELQGVMGRYYARHDGEDAAVADAIAQHWGPLGPSDRCPNAPVSVAVALADKIDTLAGFFGIGEPPTGSKDPFALRRAALGVIRLILENRLRMNLEAAFKRAAALYKKKDVKPAQGALLAFFADRLKVALREQGVRHDLIDAAFAGGGEDDLVRLLARVEALKGFVESEDGRNLLVAYRRAVNIVKIEAKKDGVARFDGTPDAKPMAAAEEKALADALKATGAALKKLLAAEDYAGAMRTLATLRGPVDAFFEKVTVNAPEPELRLNRLKLLQEIGAAMDRIADFSKVEGA